MRIVNAFLALAAIAGAAGCHSHEVAKEELPVERTQWPPLPFDQRKILAVVDFEDKSQYGKGRLGRSAADILTTELFSTNQFRLIERQRIDAVLAEQKLGGSGAIDPATAAKVGKQFGAQYVVLGVVSNFGIHEEGTNTILVRKKWVTAECTVDVRVVNTDTGEIVGMREGKGSAQRSVGDVVGLGGRMGYDETLAGDSLRAAIMKFTDNLVMDLRGSN